MARLNTRQWNLYKYLKERYAIDPKAYVTTKEIIRDLPNDYYFTQAEIENHTGRRDEMTNAEKYKTPEERMKAYASFCKNHRNLLRVILIDAANSLREMPNSSNTSSILFTNSIPLAIKYPLFIDKYIIYVYII